MWCVCGVMVAAEGGHFRLRETQVSTHRGARTSASELDPKAGGLGPRSWVWAQLLT